MDVLDFKNNYWNYYIQIEKEFFDTEPFCSIDQDNDFSFSVKYLQLYLAICSEIDSICKSFCKELDVKFNTNKSNISDYIDHLEKNYPTFSKENVIISGYKYRKIQPWKDVFEKRNTTWWKDYNKIKHNRNSNANYRLANQKNVVNALCALYILIEYWAAKNFAVEKEDMHCNTMSRFRSHKLRLENWKFYFSFMGQEEWFDATAYFKYIEQKVL